MWLKFYGMWQTNLYPFKTEIQPQWMYRNCIHWNFKIANIHPKERQRNHFGTSITWKPHKSVEANTQRIPYSLQLKWQVKTCIEKKACVWNSLNQALLNSMFKGVKCARVKCEKLKNHRKHLYVCARVFVYNIYINVRIQTEFSLEAYKILPSVHLCIDLWILLKWFLWNYKP